MNLKSRHASTVLSVVVSAKCNANKSPWMRAGVRAWVRAGVRARVRAGVRARMVTRVKDGLVREFFKQILCPVSMHLRHCAVRQSVVTMMMMMMIMIMTVMMIMLILLWSLQAFFMNFNINLFRVWMWMRWSCHVTYNYMKFRVIPFLTCR